MKRIVAAHPRRQPTDVDMQNSRAPQRLASAEARARGASKLQETKLSNFGSERALYNDFVARLRECRHWVDRQENVAGGAGSKSKIVADLKREEKRILHNVLKQADPMREVSPRLKHRDDYIDPFWDPFKEVGKVQEDIKQEFARFARLEGTAEALHERALLRRKYEYEYGLSDQLDGVSDKTRLDSSLPARRSTPVFYEGTPERFWDPSTFRRRALWNNNRPITWRSLHVLRLFVNEAGMLLPRRLTMASRSQQTAIRKAVRGAQCMGLMPYNWRAADTETMPLMDPIQFMVDVLRVRSENEGCARSTAMLRVLRRRYPDLDFRYRDGRAVPRKKNFTEPR